MHHKFELNTIILRHKFSTTILLNCKFNLIGCIRSEIINLKNIDQKNNIYKCYKMLKVILLIVSILQTNQSMAFVFKPNWVN